MKMWRIGAAALLAAGLGAAPARATDASDNKGFDASSFKPALDPFGYAVINGARSLDQFQFHVAGYFNWAKNPLSVPEDAPSTINGRDILNEVNTLDIVMGVGLLKLGNGGIEIGADLPVIVGSDGFRIDSVDRSTEEGVGDLRIGGKLTLADREDDPVGFAATLYVRAPTGNPDAFTSTNDRWAWGLTAIIEKKMGPIRFGGEVGFDHVSGNFELPGSAFEFDDRFTFGAGLAIEPLDTLPLGFYAEIVHSTQADRSWDQSEESPVELNVGAKFTGTVYFNAGAGFGLNDGVGAPDGRIFVGLGITFGSGDVR